MLMCKTVVLPHVLFLHIIFSILPTPPHHTRQNSMPFETVCLVTWCEGICNLHSISNHHTLPTQRVYRYLLMQRKRHLTLGFMLLANAEWLCTGSYAQQEVIVCSHDEKSSSWRSKVNYLSESYEAFLWRATVVVLLHFGRPFHSIGVAGLLGVTKPG